MALARPSHRSKLARCGAALLAVLLSSSSGCAEHDAAPAGTQAPSPDRPHVVLISLDTLRADHLGCYGYERDTSPVLDALAEESWLFENVIAASSSTAPAHMTLFTGVLPRVHETLNARASQLSPGLSFLPELLAQAGWRTAAFADGGIVTEAYGFDRGFEHFESRYEPWSTKLSSVEAWLERAPDEPTFLFVHTYGVHAPYLPEAGHDLFSDPQTHGEVRKLVDFLRERRDDGKLRKLALVRERFWNAVDHEGLTEAEGRYLRDLYDGCIHGVDAGVGRLLEALREKRWLDDAWLIVTSDHGEAFGEHGTYGHRQLYREELWVPLLVRPPGGRSATRLGARVSQLDFAPSVLELLDLPVPASMQGASLLPFADLQLARRVFATEGELNADAVIDGEDQVLQRAKRPLEFYALETDAGQERNQAESPAHAARLAELLDMLNAMRHDAAELQRAVGGPLLDPGELDPERLEELRALGYLK